MICVLHALYKVYVCNIWKQRRNEDRGAEYENRNNSAGREYTHCVCPPSKNIES